MLTSFLGNLYGPVDVGHIFVISGKTVDGASTFELDLASAKFDPSDIALHLTIQFHSETVIRNSLIDYAWGENEADESLMSSPNPIVPGWDFRILIMTGDEKFHIAINDQPYCSYNYRIPIDTINAISISGDVQRIFQVDHRRAFPSAWPLVHDEINRGSYLSFDVPRKFCIGHVFVLSAIASGNPNGTFVLKLRSGATQKEMLHVSSRFNQRAVIINSHTDTLEWRKDEEKYGFPFKLDQLFRLAIAMTDSSFRLAVDGVILANYNYRTSVSFLDMLAGIKISLANGLRLEIQGVDHFNTGTIDCEGFEAYTHPDAIIN